ncbi:helix-turn-helix domain-containing protein [Occallatibacter savannae]|uniref:helix-turn-helix domain-containing protein n=1 Tax=Occallatibacter savannae TaxID=1002691 RepID=UPI000D68DFB2
MDRENITVVGTLKSLERLLTLKEAGSYAGFDGETVRAWVKAGKIGAFKVGQEWRIEPKELADFLWARRVTTAA